MPQASGAEAAPPGADSVRRRLRGKQRPSAAQRRPTHALVIKETWCKKIFGSTKTWELRGAPTHKRGRIAIAQSKTNLLVGEATLVDCVPVGRR